MVFLLYHLNLTYTMMMLLWIINLTCSSKTCPNDLFSEVFSCLKHLTNGTNHTSLISGIDTVMMKRNCGNGAFDGSVQCLKRLYSRYDDPASREWLHKLARPRRWQSGFDRFCQHVNYYINERQCIQQQNTKFEACVKVNNDDFVLPKQFIHHNDGSYTVDETTLKSMCKVFDRTDKCLSGPFRNSCGKEVGAILLDFHGGLTPPMCNEFNRFHRSNMFSSTATILYPSKVNAIGTNDAQWRQTLFIQNGSRHFKDKYKGVLIIPINKKNNYIEKICVSFK